MFVHAINYRFKKSIWIFWMAVLSLLPGLYPAEGADSPKALKKKEKPIVVTSDRLEYQQEDAAYFAEGAILTQGATQLKVNLLWIDHKTRRLRGEGGVRFSDGENTIEARQIELDLRTQQGVLLDGTIFVAEDHYYLSGKRIERFATSHFDLKRATLTACDCPEGETPDWQVRASRLRLTPKSYLVVNHMFFYLRGIPVFYLPYFIYPVQATRQSGFLVPHVGYSSTQGTRYNQDIFLTLSESQDITLSVDSRDRVGSGGGLEYRYAPSQGTFGRLQTELFENRATETDRFFVGYLHRQQFSERLNLTIDARYVNQERYFSDFSDIPSERGLQNIVSNGSMTYRGDETFAYLLARYTQDLTQPGNHRPLQRLPEVGWRLMTHPVGPFYFSTEATHTRFVQDEQSWQRTDLFPTLSWPIRVASSVTLTPWSGYRPVKYHPSSGSSFDRNAVVHGVSVNTEWGNAGQVTSLLDYEFVDAESRSDVFGIAGAWPAADDLDWIHSRESVTLSIMPRLLTADRARTFGSARLTESYHIEPLSGAASATGAVDRYSDLRGEIAFHPTPALAVKMDSLYNWAIQDFSTANADLHLTWKNRLKTAIGGRFTRGDSLPQRGDPFNPRYLGDRLPASPIEFITARFLTNPNGTVRLAAQIYYDQEEHQSVEEHYGLLYVRQCWFLSLTYQDLPTRHELFFALHLSPLKPPLPKRFSYLFDF
jgi:LPS-assembly protein